MFPARMKAQSYLKSKLTYFWAALAHANGTGADATEGETARGSAGSRCAVLGGLSGEEPGRVGAKVGRQGEVDQIGQPGLERSTLPRQHRAAQQRHQPAEQQILGGLGQGRLGALVAARPQVGHGREDDRAEVGGDLRAGADRLDQEEAGELGLGGEEAGRRAKRRDHLRGPVDLFDGGGGDQLAQVSVDSIEGGQEALFLGGEVLVEDVARDRGGFDYLGDRRRPVAALGDQVGKGGEQSLALRFDDLAARETVAPAR